MDDIRRARHMLIVRAAGLIAALCAYLTVVIQRAITRNACAPITYGTMFQRDIAMMSNLRFIFNSNDTNCHNQLRMNRAPFFSLCRLFRDRVLLHNSFNTSIEEQVATFLLVVGHNHRFRALQPTFRSLETISMYFKEVLFAVGELRNEMIKPLSNQAHPKILHSARFFPYFKDCIGAIDGTHVDAKVPAAISAAFRGRKGTTTQNVMDAVDFNLKFTYVLAGWEGSAHDAHILADALEREDGLVVPAGKFYLVDALEQQTRHLQNRLREKRAIIQDLKDKLVSTVGTVDADIGRLNNIIDNKLVLIARQTGCIRLACSLLEASGVLQGMQRTGVRAEDYLNTQIPPYGAQLSSSEEEATLGDRIYMERMLEEGPSFCPDQDHEFYPSDD